MKHKLTRLFAIVALSAVLLCEDSFAKRDHYHDSVKKSLESFTGDVFNKIIDDNNRNIVISPISIFSSVGMIGKGARTNTFHEIKRAMWLNNINKVLKFTRETFRNPEFKFAQRVFVDESVVVKSVYSHVLEEYGFPDVQHLDFQKDPKGSRKIVNQWVSNKTRGQIEDLIDEEQIDSLTRFVLANAISLKASWESKFSDPFLGDYFFSPNESTKIKFIQNNMKCSMISPGDDENLLSSSHIITLPFENQDLMMTIVMPENANDFSELKSNSFYSNLFETLDRMHPRNMNFRSTLRDCNVKTPVFNVDFDYKNLKNDLQSLGIRSAFEPSSADFSGMINENVHISNIAHKATFSLDKNGIEATAATAFVISGRMYVSRINVEIDRPFVFLVRHVKTGAIFFIGKFVLPDN